MMVPADLDEEHLPTRTAYLTKDERVFLCDLDDAPYVGETLVSREREPSDGKGVVIDLDGKLRAGIYRSSGRRRKWVVVGADEIEDFKMLGVIIRYTVSD